MNELENLMGAETAPLDLSELVSKPNYSLQLPLAAVRNRASTLSLFSNDSTEAVDKFQLMMSEGTSGSFDYTNHQENQLSEKISAEDRATYLKMLGDPSVGFEQKQQIIQSMKLGPVKTDPTSGLANELLIQPSKGESPENENARVSVADAIGEVYKANQTIQGLVNSHAASLDSSTPGAILDMTELWVAPFGNSMAVSTLAGGIEQNASLWKRVKSFFLPGTEIADVRKELENLPPQERVAFAQSIISTISGNPNFVFAGKNQFAEYEKAVQIFREGGYSSIEEFIDNTSVLLDVIGLGAAVRGFTKGFKGVVAASQTPTGISVPPAGKTAPTVSKEVVTEAPSPTDFKYTIREKTTEEVVSDVSGYNAKSVNKLEAERATLMEDLGKALEPGDVRNLETERKAIELRRITDTNTLAKDIQGSLGITSKEAKKRAVKQAEEANADVEASLQRIDNQLEGNKLAAKANQKIADIDKDLEVLRKQVTVPSRLTPIADIIKRLEVNGVVRIEHPVSPHATAKQVNPEKARELFETIVKSDSDEVAQALTGVKREQAIVNDAYPQAVTSTGHVVAQPTDIQRNLRIKDMIPEKTKDYIWSTGRVDITDAERVAARAHVVRKFEDAEGITLEPSMSSFTEDGGRIKIGAMYGLPEGAFANGVDAINQAKAALRHMNLTDDELILMKREGRDYVPVSIEEGNTPGSYYVKVETSHEIDPTDITNFDKFGVRFNFFDRIAQSISGTAGSLQRHIMDAASMLDKRLTGAASTATDRGSKLEQYLLEEASKYSDKYSHLDNVEKGAVDKYILEANKNEWALDVVDLVARGFNNKQIDALVSWREFWDGHYYLENLDLVRTLRVQKYQKLDTSNTSVFARPVTKNMSNNYVYDPETDMVLSLTKQGMDDLYDNGGTVAKLRRPSEFNGETIEYIAVKNNANSYLKDIRDHDMALNYRDGYYNIQYSAPRFVDEIIVDKSGKEIRRAVAVAGDTPEAQRFASRMSTNSLNGERYEVRADDRALRTGSDDWFDVNSAKGRIAQRNRGKLLEDGSGMNHLGDGSYIVDPVSSAIHAAKSIAGRTVNRPMLETAKARFVSQYGDFLTAKEGIKHFPSSVDEIGAKGMQFTKDVADARTTFEYIRYLENGYINSVDNFFKAMMHTLSGAVGSLGAKHNIKGAAAVERGAEYISSINPMGLGKNGVFHAYIGTNFLRQLIVQPHQVVRTWFYNPVGALSGSTTKYSMEYVAGLLDIGRKTDFFKFVDESGVASAIDKQNLVRGSLTDAADNSNKVVKAVGKVLNVPRRIGFDTGEHANMVGHMASVYDRYKRAGKDLSNKVVREEAHAEARALSYDMNFAGDMPYNQNFAGLVMQFMQVPHKALLQLTNNRIPFKQRMQLLAGDLVFWGPPTLLVSELLGGDILPEDKETREAVVYGMESLILNQMFRNMTRDEDTNIDFTSLAPYDMTGWGEMFKAVLEEGTLGIISNSPAGQLYSPDGKVSKFVQSTLRFFGMQEDIEETPEQFQSVVTELLSISSGFSSGMKSYLALKTGERYDKYGQEIDTSTNRAEAVLEAFGFTDATRRDLFLASRKARKNIKEHTDEVTNDVKFILDHVTKRLEGGNADERTIETLKRTTAYALSKYKLDPEAQSIFQKQLTLRMRNPNDGLLYSVMKASGLPTGDSIKDSIRLSSATEEQKQQLIQRIEDIGKLRQGE